MLATDVMVPGKQKKKAVTLRLKAAVESKETIDKDGTYLMSDT